MPRKRKPNIKNIHPPGIVDVQELGCDSKGYRYANLVLRGVPPDQVAAVGHACALAILGVSNWPDDQAAAMAGRVREHLADRLATLIAWDDAARASSAADAGKAEYDMSGSPDDPNDVIPF